MCKQYLVTGGASQLGEHLVKMLLERGDKVRILIGADDDDTAFEGMDVEIFRGETFQKDTMKDFFTIEDPRSAILVHADERVSITNSKDLLMRRVNVSGAVNIIDLCIKNKIGRLVYLSSAYALPPSKDGYVSGQEFTFNRYAVEGDYAQTKAEASSYLMEKITLNKFDAVLVLPTFIIGPGARKDSDIGKVLNGYLTHNVDLVNGGHVFVDVRDVVAGIIAAAEKGVRGAGYILTGEYRSTVDFFQDVCEATGVDKGQKTLPNWILNKSVAKFVDTYYKLVHKKNPKDVYALFTTSPDTRYDSSSASEILELDGQTSFKDSLKETISSAI
ncbi:MAG: NAD-dependent epimerase/dehydratase family protein [Clostridia bacterium]|nr:NAD-dependent epimerase/dehydratase family protein [Clostridia bacterium]